MDNEDIDYKTFEFVKTLGKGTHGTVILAQQKNSKKKFAIKSIKKQSFDNEKQLSLIKREVEIMASLNHPHIIKVHDVCENSSRVTMTLEYASRGELFEYVNESPGGLKESESKRIFSQISSAVHYLHKKGIVHRDLKLENILLDFNRDAKIADFGLANVYSKDKLLFTYCGSPLYASPEIVKAEPYFGPEVDCWSLGVILYAMSFGVLPFGGTDISRLKNCIVNGKYTVPKHASPSLRDLITSMLEPETDQRLIMKEVVCHPWLNETVDPLWSFDDLLGGTAYNVSSAVHPPCAGSFFNCNSNFQGQSYNPCPQKPFLDKNFNGYVNLNCCPRKPPGNRGYYREEDENLSYVLGGLSKRPKHHHDFQSSSLHLPPSELLQGTSGWRVDPADLDVFAEEVESASFVRVDWGCSDLVNDELPATRPIICEVNRPKCISVCADTMIVCDFKTNSTTCLSTAMGKASMDVSCVARAKSEPHSLGTDQARASDCMFSSCYESSRVSRGFVQEAIFKEESMLEDSLNCDRDDPFVFTRVEEVRCEPSGLEFVCARRLDLGQLDSLEGSDVRVVQLQDNDDNFSVDSLDL